MQSVPHDRAARIEFERLSHAEQIAAVHRMADQGAGDYEIAHATRWHVEEVRRVLGERKAAGS